MEKLQEVLHKLCLPSLSWQKKYAENVYEKPYINVANLGNEVVYFASNGRKIKEVEAFFRIVEDILLENQTKQDLEISSFIGAGLFEAMQSSAYSKLKPPDLLNKFMGQHSLKLWGDIIEGWIGVGIRTIDQWKRVLVDRLPQKVLIEIFHQTLRIEITPENTQKLPRLLYERKIDRSDELSDMGFDTPFANIIFYFGDDQKTETLVLGNPIKANSKNHYALYRSEIFEINLTHYFETILAGI